MVNLFKLEQIKDYAFKNIALTCWGEQEMGSEFVSKENYSQNLIIDVEHTGIPEWPMCGWELQTSALSYR